MNYFASDKYENIQILKINIIINNLYIIDGLFKG